jgi:hypothetical protein
MNVSLRAKFLGLHVKDSPDALLGKAIGRAPWFITVQVTKELKRRGHKIYGRKDVEADFIIAQLALKYQDAANIVIGSDLDLLALTTNIKAMISPQNRNRGMVLEKAAILQYFDIGERELFIIAASSNCTNLIPLDEDVKFRDVHEFVLEHPAAVTDFDFSGWKGAGDHDLEMFATDLRQLYEQRHSPIKGLLCLPVIKPDDIPQQPMWLKFCSETVPGTGTLRRPMLLQRMKAVIGEDGLIRKNIDTIRAESGMYMIPGIILQPIIAQDRNRQKQIGSREIATTLKKFQTA